jgi:transcription elongation factor Elf1
MKINCLSCGHSIDLGVGYDSYKGFVKCWVCGALLDIKTEEGNLRSVKFLRTTRNAAEEALEHTSTSVRNP